MGRRGAPAILAGGLHCCYVSITGSVTAMAGRGRQHGFLGKLGKSLAQLSDT